MQEQVCPTMCLKAAQQNLNEKTMKFIINKLENIYNNIFTHNNEILINAN